eukprot:GHVS01015734.1.p1 GENE.GHVS01015734.1~~GHVS01015734.1.p1  ORF type:complete len:485 (+),score=80.90 GHVS01015734.1:1449-2903(+)
MPVEHKRCSQIDEDGEDGKEMTGLDKKRWIMMFSEQEETAAVHFFERLKEQFSRRPFSTQKFRVEAPIRKCCRNNEKDWLAKLEQAVLDCKKHAEEMNKKQLDDEDEALEPYLVVVLLPRGKVGDGIYTTLKNFMAKSLRGDGGDEEGNAIPSQFIANRTLTDPKKLTIAMEKIACQIYNKLGGIIWVMPRENTNISRMFIGIDSAPVPGSPFNVCAMVSTRDDAMSCYFSDSPRITKDTIIEGLEHFIPKALRAFIDHSHCIPDQLIVYRDGGGEGELAKVKAFEETAVVNGLKECDKKIRKWRESVKAKLEKAKKEGKQKAVKSLQMKVDVLSKDMPKFVFVICNKKVQYRFASDKSNSNPPSGTIFKEGVVEKSRSEGGYEFLCIHQEVHSSASVTPTRYVVVYNEIPTDQLSEESLQTITLQLSCMYPNWQGMVRVPAPVMLANKLARLSSDLLKGSKTCDIPSDDAAFSVRLRQRLWYL